VQDAGWTDENKTEAGWIGFGVATDVATMGGARFIQLARAAEAAQKAALAYQAASITWSATGMDAAFGYNCFVEGTLVWTEDGLRPIEGISVGDRVWSWDEATDRTTLQPVLNVFSNHTQDTVSLWMNGEQIVTTTDHPIWVEDEGWIFARDLAAGDVLRTHAGTTTLTESNPTAVEAIPVFNIDVAGGDTFFVGRTRLLVHKTSFSPARLKRVSQQIKNAPKNVGRVLEGMPPTHMQKLRAKQGRRVSQAMGRLAAIRAGIGEYRRGMVLITSTVNGKQVRKFWNGRERYFLDLDELRRPAKIVGGMLIQKGGIDRLSPRAWEGTMMMTTSRKTSVLKRQIAYVLRNGGGKHEMLPVSTFPHMAKIGVTVKDIHRMVLPTKGLKFKFPGIPAGSHHGSKIGQFAHKLLFAELRQAKTRHQALEIAKEFHKKYAVFD